MPQEREIFRSLTVEENLVVAARPGAGRWRASTISFPRSPSGGAIAATQLSGGEQQMLSIGRALMGNPTLLLMDEPLEGLAPVIVETVLEGPRSAEARGRSGASSWSSSMRASRSNSPSRRSCSTAAGSSTPARASALLAHPEMLGRADGRRAAAGVVPRTMENPPALRLAGQMTIKSFDYQ